MANPDSTVDVIEAMQAALQADAGMMTLVNGRVYDRPPQQAALPYVLFGDVLGRPVMETFGNAGDLESGFEIAVTLEVWTQTRGRSETARIMKAISDRILALAVPEWSLVIVEMIDQRIPPVEEGQRPFGFQRWRIVTDHLV